LRTVQFKSSEIYVIASAICNGKKVIVIGLSCGTFLKKITVPNVQHKLFAQDMSFPLQ
jgi:hypothetical protein